MYKAQLGPSFEQRKSLNLSHMPDFNILNGRLMPNGVAYKLIHFDMSTENDKFDLKKNPNLIVDFLVEDRL